MTECIEWQGGVDRKGYGLRWFQGKRRRAHRVAFFERHGHWPNICRHTCDNRPCVNADHLVDGTHADNNRDRDERGRGKLPVTRLGSEHVNAKLSEEDVREMRRRVADGQSRQRVADDFGMARSTVSGICSRKSWRHVTD